MDSNLLRQHQQKQQQQQQMNSGLMRYRSAPSSLIANFMEGDGDNEGCDDFIPSSHNGSSSPETERMFQRFMSRGNGDSGSSDHREIGEKSPAINNRNPQFMRSMDHEPEQNGYSQASQLVYQTPPSLSNHSSNATESAYRVVNSIGLDQHPHQMKMGSGNSSNLIRHSSSPAGLFSHLTVENGYAVMRGIGNFRAGNGTNGEAAASSSRLNGQINFPPGPPSSSGLMSQISEIGSESIGPSGVDDGSLGNGDVGNRYIPNFPIGSWDHSSLENYAGLKRVRDINGKIIPGLNPSETQNEEAGLHTPGLTHHFSLPKTSAEMAAILQFQDSVPCKIRAKRGCATHPRSIAERMRRTRISERMRKLQGLVSNMDKQTNTSDMLDLAVEYIKDLQKQVKTLEDNLVNCTCSNKQKPYSKPSV